jgi:hypothetical protein
MRYFVDGILHEYLGVARLPGGEGIAHVFLLNEWRPDSAGRLPLALVDEGGLGESVADTEIEGSGCGS